MSVLALFTLGLGFIFLVINPFVSILCGVLGLSLVYFFGSDR